jgi:hypothetical protein
MSHRLSETDAIDSNRGSKRYYTKKAICNIFNSIVECINEDYNITVDVNVLKKHLLKEDLINEAIISEFSTKREYCRAIIKKNKVRCNNPVSRDCVGNDTLCKYHLKNNPKMTIDEYDLIKKLDN